MKKTIASLQAFLSFLPRASHTIPNFPFPFPFPFQRQPRRLDFVARGRPLRGQTRLAPLAKRSTCSKSSALPPHFVAETSAIDQCESSIYNEFKLLINHLFCHLRYFENIMKEMVAFLLSKV